MSDLIVVLVLDALTVAEQRVIGHCLCALRAKLQPWLYSITCVHASMHACMHTRPAIPAYVRACCNECRQKPFDHFSQGAFATPSPPPFVINICMHVVHSSIFSPCHGCPLFKTSFLLPCGVCLKNNLDTISECAAVVHVCVCVCACMHVYWSMHMEFLSLLILQIMYCGHYDVCTCVHVPACILTLICTRVFNAQAPWIHTRGLQWR